MTFLLVGGLAALVNLGAGAAVRGLIESPWAYELRLVVGFAAGTVVSFVLNRQITFAGQQGDLWRQAFRYSVTAVVSIGVASVAGWCSLAVLGLFAGIHWLYDSREVLSHLAAIGITTIYNYIAIKYFALRADRGREGGRPGPPPSLQDRPNGTPVM